MRPAVSLRSRLLLVMLAPLLCISLALGTWRVIETNRITADLFDRTLLSAGLSIARDFGVREGEALSTDTLQLLRETSGGRIFYHVKGPDGSFVTGYATPPVNPTRAGAQPQPILSETANIYSGIYRGAPVRVVRLTETVDMGWVQGDLVISVWQDLSARNSFAWQIVRQTIIILALLLLTVLGLTWFGLRLALRPLTDLEAAIAQRGAKDLSPIKRSVPVEVTGIVATFNQLLDRISRRISSKDEFISNAAHQLRNPIAGVLSLTQSLERQVHTDQQRERVAALMAASQHLSRLSNQLLSFERNRELGQLSDTAEVQDLNVLALEVIERAAPDLLRKGFEVSFEKGPEALIKCQPILVQEILQNLIDNAVQHGGKPDLNIIISVECTATEAILRVRDDGVGMRPKDRLQAFARFSQVRPGAGSGLGLAIADKICTNHRGALQIDDVPAGTSIAAHFPRVHAQPADSKTGASDRECALPAE